MANQYAMLSSGGGASFSASTTYYPAINGAQATNTTEANNRGKWRGAGTIDQLYVNVITATTGATTVDVRNNGSSTAVTVSCTGATTGTFSDLTHSATIADGDPINLRVVAGATGSFVANMTSRFATSGQVSTMLQGAGSASLGPGTGSNFLPGAGSFTGPTSTETQTGVVMLESATLSNLQIVLSANSVTGSHGLNERKNEAAASQTVSVTASTAGTYEDVTNTDTYAAGDRFDTVTF